MTRDRSGLTVRFVAEYTSILGTIWREYEDAAGNRARVQVRTFLERQPKSNARCRAEAARKLGGGRSR